MTDLTVGKVLSDLANLSDLTGALPGGPLPDRLCWAVTDQVAVSGASMGLMRQTQPAGTVCASDPTALALEELQFSLREGPCVDAARRRRPVLEPDLRRLPASRWPALLPALASLPIRAVFAFPLQIGQIRVGVLDLYRDRPGELSDRQLDTAQVYADAATAILLAASPAPDGAGGAMAEPGIPDLLVDPVRHRAPVHQATGMVMVQAQVSMEEAFQLLVARAYAEGRSLLDLARGVVARTVRFAPLDQTEPDPRRPPVSGPDGREGDQAGADDGKEE